MHTQKTISKPIPLAGIGPFGGNPVDITFVPAKPDTGIIFTVNEGGVERQVKATLQNTYGGMCTTKIKNKGLTVLNAEHILATKEVFDISNLEIQIKTHCSISREIFKYFDLFRLHKNTVVIPYFQPNLQTTVCEAIESTGIIDQGIERPTQRLKETIQSSESDPKLIFTPNNTDNLIFKVFTDYPVIGKQEIEIIITPETYKQIANARSYNKHLGGENTIRRGPEKWATRGLGKIITSDNARSFLARGLCYPWFGFNHGFTRDTNFFPTKTKKQWLEQERMYSEIAAHSIIDALGRICLLEEKLVGVTITCKYAGHKDYLKFLKANFN